MQKYIIDENLNLEKQYMQANWLAYRSRYVEKWEKGKIKMFKEQF